MTSHFRVFKATDKVKGMDSKKEIVRIYESGKTLRETAYEVNKTREKHNSISEQQVSKILKILQVNTRRNCDKKIAPSEFKGNQFNKEIIALYEYGFSLGVISKILYKKMLKEPISKVQVGKLLKLNGVPLRSSSHQRKFSIHLQNWGYLDDEFNYSGRSIKNILKGL